MSDTHLSEFEKRLHRIDQIREAGGAFEANGALGRSYFDSVRPRARRGFPLRGLALILGGVLLVKAVMLAQIGQEEYARRVAELQAGNVFQKSAAWVMNADPATRVLTSYLRPLLR